jgi:hypothetical protein
VIPVVEGIVVEVVGVFGYLFPFPDYVMIISVDVFLVCLFCVLVVLL